MSRPTRGRTVIPCASWILLALTVSAPTGAWAQTITDPHVVQFSPSPDHGATLSDGRPMLTKYVLQVYVQGAASPFTTTDMGKPAPDPDGLIRYDFSANVSSWTPPGGVYEARVAAVGPQGQSVSGVSDPFTLSATAGCGFSLSQSAIGMSNAAGTTSVSLNATPGCPWTTTSNASWLTAMPVSGIGSGNIALTVSANTSGTPRTGIVTVAGRGIWVTQGDTVSGDTGGGGGACSASVSPTSVSLGSGGGTASIAVSSTTGCAWTATSAASWISVSPSSGTGNGSVTLSLQANLSGASRTETVTAAGKPVIIAQAAGSGATSGGSGDGLRGEYFDNMDLTAPVGTRIDATVSFDWGSGAPLAGMGADTFSARWTGQVQPQFTETYTFYTVSDDGVRLWVNGQLVVDNWTNHAATENSGSIALVAGQRYEIKLEYFENAGGAVARLSWSSPSTPKAMVPKTQLYSVSSALDPGSGGTSSGSGDGLRAEYYDNWDLAALVGNRVDPTVDFDWGTGAPLAGMQADTFSARWTGQVRPQFSETYTFYTVSDDGVRLWVNGQLLIDNWTNHAPTENSGSIALVAGQRYDVKLEYFENGMGAVARLLWSSPSTAKGVIPRAQLYSASSGSGSGGGGGGTGPGSGDGLRGDYFDNWDLTAPVGTRVDATLDFDWQNGAPQAGMGADTFSARWTGKVQAQFSETYTFYTVSDDGVRVWVNGQLLIDNWTNHAATENSGSIALTGGQSYDIKVEYFENGGGAVARLLWSSPSTPKAVIPRTQLYSAASGSGGGSGSAGSGDGLRGDYFDNWDFTAPVASQVDAAVDFDWGTGAPLAGMQADTFSVRWTGRLVAPSSETYTFYTVSDDGVRLWVNGQLIIDNWTNHAPTENSGTITLAMGQVYTIKLEYFENGSGAVVRLLWSSGLMPKGVVPRAVLYSK